MRRRLTLAAALALAVGCQSSPGGSAPTPQWTPARDSLLAIDVSRSDSVAMQGIVAGTLAWLSPDAVYLRNGVAAVYGRGAIRALLVDADAAANRAPTPSWQPLGGAVSADQRAGYTFGITARPGGGAGQGPVLQRYLAYWERPAGGPWKVVAYVEIGAPPVNVAVESVSPPVPCRTPGVARTCLQLVGADSAFAERSHLVGTPSAFAAAMAPDGITLSGSELIIGPRSERDFLEAQRASLTWNPVYAGAAASGDLGFTVGVSVSTGRGATGAAVQHFGKYLTVWRRDDGGAWKVAVDGSNGTQSPGGAPPAPSP